MSDHAVVYCRNEEEIRIDNAIRIAEYVPKFRRMFQKDGEADKAADFAEKLSEGVLDGTVQMWHALNFCEKTYFMLKIYHDQVVYNKWVDAQIYPYGR